MTYYVHKVKINSMSELIDEKLSSRKYVLEKTKH